MRVRGAGPTFITSFLPAFCSPGRALFTLLLQPLLAVVTTLSGRGGAGAAALVLAPDVDALAGNALVVCVYCALRCADQLMVHVTEHFDDEQLHLLLPLLAHDAVLPGDGDISGGVEGAGDAGEGARM
jgi:hypothetical protein